MYETLTLTAMGVKYINAHYSILYSTTRGNDRYLTEPQTNVPFVYVSDSCFPEYWF